MFFIVFVKILRFKFYHLFNNTKCIVVQTADKNSINKYINKRFRLLL